MENSRFNTENEPVCRFGPGGDFTSIWPGKDAGSSLIRPNSLSKVLASIAQTMGIILGSAPAGTSKTTSNTQIKCIFFAKEKHKHESKSNKTDKSTDAPSTTIIKGHRQLPDEPMLFSDDSRAGRRAGHKSKHRVRAHRRTSKKRSPDGMRRQGTLFDANLKSARTA